MVESQLQHLGVYELHGERLVAFWNHQSHYWLLCPGDPLAANPDYLCLGRLLLRAIYGPAGLGLRGTRWTVDDLAYVGMWQPSGAESTAQTPESMPLDMDVWGSVFDHLPASQNDEVL